MRASWMALLLETAVLVEICILVNPLLSAFFLRPLPHGEKENTRQLLYNVTSNADEYDHAEKFSSQGTLFFRSF
jgi:hypothetical protein